MPTAVGARECAVDAAEQIRQRLGLALEEKTTGEPIALSFVRSIVFCVFHDVLLLSTARGCLLVVQSAITPQDSGIQHEPASKIRCGDVLCRGAFQGGRCISENFAMLPGLSEWLMHFCSMFIAVQYARPIDTTKLNYVMACFACVFQVELSRY